MRLVRSLLIPRAKSCSKLLGLPSLDRSFAEHKITPRIEDSPGHYRNHRFEDRPWRFHREAARQFSEPNDGRQFPKLPPLFFASRAFCSNCLRHEAVPSSSFLRSPNTIELLSVAYRDPLFFHRETRRTP